MKYSRVFSLFKFLATLMFLMLPIFSYANTSNFTKEINYQGKLTDSTGATVADGNYNMQFKLYNTLTGGAAIWTGTLIQNDRPAVVGGLFSVLLGATSTDLSGVDFNKPLYLSINIGGTANTATPTWDGEMTPRKTLGTVPYAFNSDTIDGLDSTAFVRADSTSTVATTSTQTLLALNQLGTGGLLSLQKNGSALMTVVNSGSVGIGSTTTPSSLLSLQGSALFSGNLTLANLTATGTLTVQSTTATSTFSTGGLTVGTSQLVVEQNSGLVGIGTTTPIDNLDVAGKTVAFNSASDGSLAAWSTNANALPVALGDTTSVVNNGYVYVLGGYNGVSPVSTVYYAKINSNGALGSWSTNINPLPANIYEHSSVVANGYVYVIGGDSGGGAIATVYYAKINANGSIGPWATNANALPAVRQYAVVVVANDYLYVIGGDTGSAQSTVYYAKLNGDGSTGSWITSPNSLPAARRFQNHSAVVANGYVYVIGGDSGAGATATVYYAKLQGDGSIGSWSTNVNALPASLRSTSSVVANGYVYVIGGYDGSSVQTSIYYAKLNSDGSIGSWSTNANSLPAERLGQASVIANGYIYAIGGGNNSFTVQSSVYYSSVARVQMASDLDLLGLASTTLSDVNGGIGDGSSVGGSIFAGNIFGAGKLEITNGAELSGGLAVNDTMSLAATTSGNQSFSVLSINNATSTSPLLTVQYAGNVGIGTTTPSSLLSLQGNALFSGNLTLANLTATGTLSFSSLGGSMLTAINSSGVLSSTSTPTAAYYLATSSIASVLPYASTTALSSSGSAFFATSGGSVGIGTTSPYTTLSVTGGATTLPVIVADSASSFGGSIRLSSTAAGGRQFDIISTVNGNSDAGGGSLAFRDFGVSGSVGYRMVVNSSGNVGIGTTSPYALLSVNANSSNYNSTIFSVASSTSSYATSTFFDVLANGNVGVGTTTPASLFSINNVANFTSATSTFSSTGGLDLTAGCFSVRGTCVGGGGSGTINSGTINRLSYYSGATTLDSANFLAIDTSNQLLGVGATSSPFAALSVASLNGKIPFAVSTSTASATTTAFIIDKNGNVGIGTTSPTLLGNFTNASLAVHGSLYVTGSTTLPELTLSAEGLSGSMGSTTPRTNTLYRENIIKAWVDVMKYNGSASPISDSFNVSSITRNATGEYTVNFQDAFSSSNYVVSGSCSGNNVANLFFEIDGASTYQTRTSSAVAVACVNNSGSYVDATTSVMVIGNQ